MRLNRWEPILFLVSILVFSILPFLGVDFGFNSDPDYEWRAPR